MASFYFENNPETGEKLNELARHEMMARLLADIRTDIMICQLEGWDYREYLGMIKEAIDGFYGMRGGS